MQPNTPPGPNGNPYDFILNEQAPKKSWLSTNSVAMRIGLVVGGLFLLIVIALAIFSSVGSSGKVDSAALTDIAQRQQNIIYIATEGGKLSKSTSVRSFAATTESTMASAQSETLNFLAKNGRSIKPANLTAGIDPAIKTSLDAASQNNTIDETVNKLLQDNLLSYQAAVKSAYDATTHTQARQLLNSNFEAASTLLKAPDTAE